MSSDNKNVLILGLGGGGSRIAARLAQQELPPGYRIVAADTDAEALRGVAPAETLLLGEEWTKSEGTGGNLTLGEQAVTASAEELQKMMNGVRLLIFVCALGGGTGTGGARVVARLAREQNLTPVLIATIPFAFEGNWRRREADKCLEPLRNIVDTIITVPNDFLFNVLSADTPAAYAFEMMDTLLAEAIAGLAYMNSAQGMLPADFATLRTVLRQRSSTCALGVGRGTGENRWQQALDAFMQCPLIGGRERLANAHAAVLTLMGPPDLTIGEVQACMNALQHCFSPEARLVIGAYTFALPEFRLTGLLCQYIDQPQPRHHEISVVSPGHRAQQTEGRAVQGELPLQEQSLGIFAGVLSTTVNGQNLDIPTFQRRGVTLDAGD